MTDSNSEFAAYLEAKAAVDDRSLNMRARTVLHTDLPARRAMKDACLECLDLGTGTGAMIRRLIRDFGSASGGVGVDPGRGVQRYHFCGVDLNSDLLEFARNELAAIQLPSTVSTEFVVVGVEQALQTECRYDLISAHALMDLLPMIESCAGVYRALQPGGLFYATLNYNGLTRFYPDAETAHFETELLAAYDRSMCRSGRNGDVEDGAASGGRLFGACREVGFDILVVGGSDWCVFPGIETADYAKGEDGLLRWMLENIYKEGRSRFGLADLDRWRDERIRHLDEGRLALVVHHLDLLARRPM